MIARRPDEMAWAIDEHGVGGLPAMVSLAVGVAILAALAVGPWSSA